MYFVGFDDLNFTEERHAHYVPLKDLDGLNISLVFRFVADQKLRKFVIIDGVVNSNRMRCIP